MEQESGVEIVTLEGRPFAFGPGPFPIKTQVTEYEVVDIGRGFSGVLVRNTEKKLFHLAEMGCGCIIGTGKTRGQVLSRVRKDVKTGEEGLMAEQIVEGKALKERADLIEAASFFSRFKAQ